MKNYSYDESCEELAKQFLSDYEHTPEQVQELAQEIQNSIETYIDLEELKEK